MSAEGKKKRGEAGMSNAKNIPFRYHGYPKGYTLSTNTYTTTHPRLGGSRMVNAMRLGAMIGGVGYNPSDRAYRAVDEAMDHCISY